MPKTIRIMARVRSTKNRTLISIILAQNARPWFHELYVEPLGSSDLFAISPLGLVVGAEK